MGKIPFFLLLVELGNLFLLYVTIKGYLCSQIKIVLDILWKFRKLHELPDKSGEIVSLFVEDTRVFCPFLIKLFTLGE